MLTSPPRGRKGANRGTRTEMARAPTPRREEARYAAGVGKPPTHTRHACSRRTRTECWVRRPTGRQSSRLVVYRSTTNMKSVCTQSRTGGRVRTRNTIHSLSLSLVEPCRWSENLSDRIENLTRFKSTGMDADYLSIYHTCGRQNLGGVLIVRHPRDGHIVATDNSESGGCGRS